MKSNCNYPLNWSGCYKGQYDIWCKEAYSHPAKMSPALCFRIFEHLKELGWLKPSDTILDPLAGIGTTGLVAATLGYSATLIELEDKFVNLTTLNIEHLEKNLHRKVNIRVIQGDSRHLSDFLEGENGPKTVLSPPYKNAGRRDDDNNTLRGIAKDGSRRGGILHREHYSDNPSNIGNLPDKLLKAILSPPYGESQARGTGIGLKGYKGKFRKEDYDIGGRCGYFKTSDTEGQIANLSDRPQKTITSPPYEDSLESGSKHGDSGIAKCDPSIGNLPNRPLKAIISPPYEQTISKVGGDTRLERIGISQKTAREYGSTPGQIGNLKGITSPPYSNPRHTSEEYDDKYDLRRPPGKKWGRVSFMGRYGEAEGQIGKEDKEDYLSAMKVVYSEIAKVSDVLVVVTKNPTRQGKLRNLALDTFLLLKTCHFILYCNCETHKKKGIKLNDREWQIYQTLLQQGKGLFNMQCFCNEVKDGGMPQAQPKVNEAQIALRRNKSEALCRICNKPQVPEDKQLKWNIECYHRSLLFEEQKTQDLFGEVKKKPKGRIGFFKLLSYKKGSEVAMWEDTFFCKEELKKE